MWRAGPRLWNPFVRGVIPTSSPSHEPYWHSRTLLRAAGVTNDVCNVAGIDWRASLVNQYEHGLLERSEQYLQLLKRLAVKYPTQLVGTSDSLAQVIGIHTGQQ